MEDIVAAEADTANVRGENGSLLRSFLANLFEARPSAHLQILRDGEPSYSRAAKVAEGVLGDELYLAAFQSSEDSYRASHRLAYSQRVPLGSSWKGHEADEPNYLIVDAAKRELVAIWIGQDALPLDSTTRKLARKERVPLPVLASQLVELDSRRRFDIGDGELLEKLAAPANWEVNESDLIEDGAACDQVCSLLGTTPRSNAAKPHPRKLRTKPRDFGNVSSYEVFHAALSLAKKGLRVHPVHGIESDGLCSCLYVHKKTSQRYGEPMKRSCEQPGKHPKISEWQLRASNDVNWVQEEFTQPQNRYGATNLGVATGRDSGVFVVDLDGAEGVANWEEFIREKEQIPSTLTTLTGGGGMHIYFRYPRTLEVRNSASKFAGHGSKIDIRGEGGYVIAPPSKHRSGISYTWQQGCSPEDIEIAEAPAFVLAEIARISHASETFDHQSSDPSPVEKDGSGVTAPVEAQNLDASVRAALGKIGDGGDKEGFDSPINQAAISYFRVYGVEADRLALKNLLVSRVSSTTTKTDRFNLSRYLSDEYLDKRIEGAREYVRSSAAANEHSLPLGYSVRNGMIVVERKVGDRTTFDEVCQDFEVIALSRDSETSDNWAVVLRFVDGDGKEIDCAVPLEDLYSNAKAARGALGRRGFKLRIAEIAAFDRLLSQVDVATRITTVTRPGWHNGAFVCPDGSCIGAPSEVIEYRHALREPTKAGELVGSQKAFEAAIASGVSHWIIGALSGGVASLAQYLKQDSCLIALTGETSRGKTTALSLGVSWWGNPVLNGKLLVSLNGTENSFEAAIEASTGIGFFGDEMKHLPGHVIQKIIFLLAGGKGKRRLASNATAREVRTWETFGLLSGEMTLADAIREDRSSPASGIMARCLEVDVSSAPIVELEIVDAVQDCRENFGHFGPAFVRHLIEHESRDRLLARLEELVAVFEGGMNSQQTAERSSLRRRAVRVVALCALVGEVLQRADLLSAKHDFVALLEVILQAQVDKEALSPVDRAIDQLQANLQASSRIHRIEPSGELEPGQYGDALGWRDAQYIYLRADKLVELAGGTATSAAILNGLARRNLLCEPQSGKNRAFNSLPGRRARNYRLLAQFLEE